MRAPPPTHTTRGLADPIRNAHNLEEGPHTITVLLASDQHSSEVHFRCQLAQYFTPLRVYESSVVVPDLVDGIPQGPFQIAMSISNHGPAIIGDLEAGFTDDLLTIRSNNSAFLQPNQIVKVGLSVEIAEGVKIENSLVVPVVIASRQASTQQVFRVKIKNKRPGSPFKMSFFDQDGSLRIAHIVPPLEDSECSEFGCGVIVLLHEGRPSAVAKATAPYPGAWVSSPPAVTPQSIEF